MSTNHGDILDVLKNELKFVEEGGYKNPQPAAWRPAFMFQDSPSCLNFEVSQQPKPCSDCALMQLVPEESQDNKVPCRYIPLNEEGATLDLLYRTGTQEEIESTFTQWLKTRIARLEQERTEKLRASDHPEIHVRAKFVSGC
jgi:hypothetical protein